MYDFIAFEDFSAPNTLAYEAFRELMDVCFRHASFFSMNRSRWGDSCNDASLEEELAPFLDRKIETLQDVEDFDLIYIATCHGGW